MLGFIRNLDSFTDLITSYYSLHLTFELSFLLEYSLSASSACSQKTVYWWYIRPDSVLVIYSTWQCIGDTIERTVYWWYNRNGRCIGDTIHRTAYWWYNRTDSVLVVQSTGLALVIQSYGLCIGDTIERTVYWWFNQLDDVCESGMGNPTVTSHITLSVVILTGTSSILSIIGAGIVFITFWRMPEIRNFTRWLLLYLTIADFFTAVFNLVGVGRY